MQTSQTSLTHGYTAMLVIRRDVYIVVAIAIVTGVVSVLLHNRLSFTMTALDVWFDSDSALVFDQMTDRYAAGNDTNSRHPLFVTLTYPVVFVLTRFLGMSAEHAAQLVLVTKSVVFTTLMYVTLRLANRSALVSAIFTSVLIFSSAGLLFLGVHERLVLGGISILLCISVFRLYEKGRAPVWGLTLAAALTLGITITNFVVGIVSLLLALGWRRGAQQAINAFALVVILSGMNSLVFEKSTHVADLGSWPVSSAKVDGATALMHKSAGFWFHSAVLPEHTYKTKPAPWLTQYVSVQETGIWSYSLIGYIALSLWVALIGSGVVRTAKAAVPSGRDGVDILVGVAAISQLALFSVFGAEPILYSVYYLPLLLFLASKPPPGRRGYVCFVTVSCVFLLALIVSNLDAFAVAVESAAQLANGAG
jgi:hypothetical protein